MDRENFAAVFSVSVDLPGQLESSSAVGQFGSILDDMLALFDEYKVPAVWGMSQPAASPWTTSIRRRHVAHEIALLGEASWLNVGRTRLVHELGRRVESAASVGIRLGTLLLRGTSIPSDLDVFQRHRVQLLRGDIHSRLRSKVPYQLRTVSLKHHVWQVPASAVIVGRRSFWPGAESAAAVKAIHEAVALGGFCHLAVDLTTAADESVPVIGAVRRVLRAAEHARKKGQLQIATVSQAASQFVTNMTAPTQSVLRRAG